MKNLYLDIDGTIITIHDDKEAKHLHEFLSYAVKNFNCYWLTNHCKGDIKPALYYLKSRVSPESFELLEKFKPTNWDRLKTDAIDFSSDFIWLDDYIFDAEKEILIKNNSLEKLILIDLDENPDQLLEFTKKN